MWTVEQVAARFHEAAQVAQRLPPVRVQGYFNLWPALRPEPWARFAHEDRPCHCPPDPAAIERMLETMRWIRWLEEEPRHLIWMRAKAYPWRDIARRFGCDRSTAWRRWQSALQIVASELNQSVTPSVRTIR